MAAPKETVTVGQLKRQMAEAGFEPGEIANAFRQQYGKYGEAAYESDSVQIGQIPTEQDLAKSKGGVAAKVSLDLNEQLNKVEEGLGYSFSDEQREQAAELGVDMESIARYRRVPQPLGGSRSACCIGVCATRIV